MIYSIVYDAVRKKAQAQPPVVLIGNVEMAAGIGLVLEQTNRSLDLQQLETPEELKEMFLGIMTEDVVSGLPETEQTIVSLIKNYEVRKMVNEKIYNLVELSNRVAEDSGQA